MYIKKDQLWKSAFRLLMQQFVGFFFPDQYDEVDWTKEVVFLDKELSTILLNSRPKNRIADVLVMLTLKNGEKRLLFLHIEVQGYPDKSFGLRVHQMRYRIEDLMGEPPVMLSVFTDDDPNYHPKEYYAERWGASTRTVFNTYKVMEHPPETYSDPNNPVALMMEIIYNSTQIKKLSDKEIMDAFIGLTKKLVSSGYTREYILLMKNFIEAHVTFGDNKNYRIFGEKIEKMVKYETTADILSWLDNDKLIAGIEREKKAKERLLKAAERTKKIIERMQTRMQTEKERMQTEKERMQTEKERMQTEKERLRERSVVALLGQAMSKETIAAILETTVADIQAIEEKYKDNNPSSKPLNDNSSH